MIKRLLESRSGKKFFRRRLAVVSLAVVLVYMCVAVIMFFGMFTLSDTEKRVGPNGVSGFFRLQRPEKRMSDCEQILSRVESSLNKRKRRNGAKAAKTALAEIRYGERRLKDMSLDDFQDTVDSAWGIYDELDEEEDVDEQPELLPRIAELEEITNSLFASMSPSEERWQNFYMFLGTDRQGRSISVRAIYSVKVAVQIGVVTSLISVMIGSLLGAAAAFFGGWVDHVVIWLYTTLSSIPNLVLLVLLAYMVTGTNIEQEFPLVPVYAAFCLTFWIGPCRVIRGETLKIKELEYVQASTSFGAGRFYILFRHIFPNAAHLILVNFSLLFIGAIKSEVILSYLGLGVKRGPSWGIMIQSSVPEVVNGFFWQIGTATALMFGLVLAFNILTDTLQDAFDPKHQ